MPGPQNIQQPQLRFDGISKRFPGVRALDQVSFEVRGGSVHALLGENGAGKSTLLKVLSGAYQPDAGQLLLDGRPAVFRNAAAALSAGVAVIYQELHLAPELSVADNLFLGHLPATAGWIRGRTLFRATRDAMEALGEDIDPRARVSALSIAQRQMIEIAKALTRDARVLAFDEPTSSLSSREVERLFTVIGRLRAQGRIVLYVTHRMEEVFRICDAATVLRDGRHVETYPSLTGVAQGELVARMVGRSIADIFHYAPRERIPGPPAIEIENLEGLGLSRPATLAVARGEILGIFGLVGAGRTELLKLICSARVPSRGAIRVHGASARFRSPRDAIRGGVVLCPEDRKKEGIIPIRSVMDNLNISGRRHFSPLRFIISGKRERDNARAFVERLAIRTPSLHQLIVNLSGGNQQKVILARWLCENLKVVLLDEPTRGIDVGAKSEIYSIIYELAGRGIGVIAVSSELPEVMGIADRVLVMRQGRLVADIPRHSPEFTSESILARALPVSNVQEGAK
jgi:L-arabinose transport system ATP-binding protein